MKTEDIIAEALKVLRDGGVILYPTDTVWGIGCDATNPVAVERVFQIKRRSWSKSLVLLASDLDMVARYVKAVPNMAIDLVEVNDRPMTIIYPGAIVGPQPSADSRAVRTAGNEPFGECSPHGIGSPAAGGNNAESWQPERAGDRHLLAWNVVAEDGSVGIRIPMMEFCRTLAYKLGRPIVSTSANISGEPTPEKFKQISPEIISAVNYVVPAPLEKESTGRASQIIKVGLGGEIEIIRA